MTYNAPCNAALNQIAIALCLWLGGGRTIIKDNDEKSLSSSFVLGITFTLVLAVCSIALAKTSFFSAWHISPLILGIVLSIVVASVLRGFGVRIIDECRSGVDSAVKSFCAWGLSCMGFLSL